MNSWKLKTLIIIPCYNESSNIIELVDILLGENEHADVLIIDDSSDNTAELITKHQIDNTRLFLIKRKGKGGRGTAVLDGFRFALTRDYKRIAEMDADFSHDPYELKSLLTASGDNTIVIGSRYLKKSKIVGWPLSRRVFSKLANFFARIILRIPINDYTNGYRVYGREALEKLEIRAIKGRGFIVLSEISYFLFQNGVKFIEVPTVFVNRKRGASNFSLKEVIDAFIALVKIRFN